MNERIARLEERIVALRRELRDADLSAHQRNERELALANAEEALHIFRWAYVLEQRADTED